MPSLGDFWCLKFESLHVVSLKVATWVLVLTVKNKQSNLLNWKVVAHKIFNKIGRKLLV